MFYRVKSGRIAVVGPDGKRRVFGVDEVVELDEATAAKYAALVEPFEVDETEPTPEEVAAGIVSHGWRYAVAFVDEEDDEKILDAIEEAEEARAGGPRPSVIHAIDQRRTALDPDLDEDFEDEEEEEEETE